MSDPLPLPPENPPQPLRRFAFTKENARAFQAKAAIARRQNAAAALAKLQEAETAKLLLPAFTLAVLRQGKVEPTLNPRLAAISQNMKVIERTMERPDLAANDLVRLSERLEALIRLEAELIGQPGEHGKPPRPASVDPIFDDLPGSGTNQFTGVAFKGAVDPILD